MPTSTSWTASRSRCCSTPPRARGWYCRAADLRGLHLHARRQLALLLMHYGFDPTGPLCEAELQAWAEPPVYAATRDLLGSMNQFKDMAWHHFVSVDRSLPEAASQQWEGFFRTRRWPCPAGGTTALPGSVRWSWSPRACCRRGWWCRNAALRTRATAPAVDVHGSPPSRGRRRCGLRTSRRGS
jgi:hypothetical protein